MFKFYRINNDYVEYLRKKDFRVMDKNDGRISVGVVLFIDNIKYYVPLSNVDDKSKYFKNETEILEVFSWDKRIDVVFDEKGKKIALLRYDYMLPVPNSELEEVDRNQLKGAYKRKVENEYKYCNKNKSSIEKKALEIYKVRTTITFNNTDLNKIMEEINWSGKRRELKKYKENLEHSSSGSCDFKILETALIEWEKSKQQ